MLQFVPVVNFAVILDRKPNFRVQIIIESIVYDDKM